LLGKEVIMKNSNIIFKYAILLFLLIFMISFVQLNRYVVIPPSVTMPSIIFDKLRFKAYRVFTSEDETGETRITGFCEMEMRK
jgi:hypothetical protein